MKQYGYGKLFLVGFLGVLIGFTSQANSILRYSQRTDVHQFISQMVTKHHFNRNKLETLFDKVKPLPPVLQSISRPYETKPWYIYRSHFLNTRRVEQGLQFWQRHEKTLQRAAKKYGVPPSIIVAILGIETYYGKHMGTYPVFDALATIAFNYPPRAKFFKKELAQFLLLTREQHLNPLKLHGSYAGAMGQPQFMPSSYRHYAVGSNGQSKADLLHNTNDAIASIGNYFKEHGWQTNQPIVQRVRIIGDAYKKLPPQKRDPKLLLSDLHKYGIFPTPPYSLPAAHRTNLIKLKTDKKKAKFWLGFHNFSVIRRYNTSSLYAMAVVELSQELKHLKHHTATKKQKVIYAKRSAVKKNKHI